MIGKSIKQFSTISSMHLFFTFPSPISLLFAFILHPPPSPSFILTFTFLFQQTELLLVTDRQFNFEQKEAATATQLKSFAA